MDFEAIIIVALLVLGVVLMFFVVRPTSSMPSVVRYPSSDMAR